MNISIRQIFSIVKNITLIIFLCLSGFNTMHGQNCTICSQSEVDNFSGNLGGHIVISGPDITNLDALADNIGGSFLSYLSISIINNPVLTDISGISLIPLLSNTPVLISDNPLLESVSFPVLTSTKSLDILNNVSLDSIYVPEMFCPILKIQNNGALKYIGLSANNIINSLTIDNTGLDSIDLPEINFSLLEIQNNDALNYIGLSANNSINILTIENNATLENLDGMNDFSDFTTMTISNNTQLRYYCALYDIFLDNPVADITITGNLKNPTYQEIFLEGTCGNYVRNFIGYETLTEALDGANDYDIIFVARDIVVDSPTIFSNIQNQTLFIRPTVNLTFNAPFTNEGIVINHGTVEMMPGATFTNSGVFANTGQLIAN